MNELSYILKKVIDKMKKEGSYLLKRVIDRMEKRG